MTAVPTTAGAEMRRHALPVVLALSLALNLFFVAGAVWTHLHAPGAPATREQRFEQMAAALSLDRQQKAAFTQYTETMRTHIETMRETIRPLVHAAWSELAKPQADEAKVMQLLDRAGNIRHDALRELTATTLAFMRTLTPPQRTEFVKLAHQRPTPWSPEPGHRPH